MRNYQRKWSEWGNVCVVGTVLPRGPASGSGQVSRAQLCFFFFRQASLRYRELNDALETVQEKLRDARVHHMSLLYHCFLSLLCMHVV